MKDIKNSRMEHYSSDEDIKNVFYEIHRLSCDYWRDKEISDSEFESKTIELIKSLLHKRLRKKVNNASNYNECKCISPQKAQGLSKNKGVFYYCQICDKDITLK